MQVQMWISFASQLQSGGLLRVNVSRGKRHRRPVSREGPGKKWQIETGSTGMHALKALKRLPVEIRLCIKQLLNNLLLSWRLDG